MARLNRVAKAVESLGCSVTKPKRGSHWKVSKEGHRPYTLPASNGKRTDIDDNYIRGLCRNFGFDADEFRGLL